MSSPRCAGAADQRLHQRSAQPGSGRQVSLAGAQSLVEGGVQSSVLQPSGPCLGRPRTWPSGIPGLCRDWSSPVDGLIHGQADECSQLVLRDSDPPPSGFQAVPCRPQAVCLICSVETLPCPPLPTHLATFRGVAARLRGHVAGSCLTSRFQVSAHSDAHKGPL